MLKKVTKTDETKYWEKLLVIRIIKLLFSVAHYNLAKEGERIMLCTCNFFFISIENENLVPNIVDVVNLDSQNLIFLYLFWERVEGILKCHKKEFD